MKILILGFYGVGKTTYVKDHLNAVDITDFKIDSVNCDPDALKKYWEDEDHDIVLADPQWTKVILQSGYPFYVVVPTSNRKSEFMFNFQRRWIIGEGGGDNTFCQILDKCWTGWLDVYTHKLPCVEVITLSRGKWLSDAINYIKNK